MSLHILTLEQKPTDVAISSSGTRLAVLSDKSLAVYALDMLKRPLPKPVLLWRSDAVQGHSPRHVTFVGDEQIYVLTDSWDEDESFLWRSEGEELLPQGPIIEAENISSLTSSTNFENLYAQFANGALHQIRTSEALSDLPPETSLVHKFPSFAPEVKIIVFDEQVRMPGSKLVALANDSRHWLSA